MPTPSLVRTTPFTSLTSWRSCLELTPGPELEGAESGVSVPFKSLGAIRRGVGPSNGPNALTFGESVSQLRQDGFTDDQIWDMLLGMQLGLMEDIAAAAGTDRGISTAVLNAAVEFIGRGQRMDNTGSYSDMAGERAFTKGIGSITYSAMAAEVWLKRKLQCVLIIESQGGAAVLRVDKDGKLADGGSLTSGRMHMLPLDCDSAGDTRRVVFVARDASRYHACAIAMSVRKPRTGSGKWQLRRIG